MKFRSILTLAFHTVVFSDAYPMYSNEVRAEQELPQILCPMLAITNPGSSRASKFLAELSREGNIGYMFALLVHFNSVRQQQGIWASITGRSIDTDRLDEVPEISTIALFQSYPDEVGARFEEAADEDGMIFLQDMVDTREWIAGEVGVTSFSFLTRGQVVAGFLAAGGSVETAKVEKDKVLQLLNGIEPEGGFGRINYYRILKTYTLADWTIS